MYWIKVLRRWMHYTAEIYVVALVGNLILYGMVSADNQGMAAIAQDISHHRDRSSWLFALGPLVNIYIWGFCFLTLSEAEDDIFLQTEQAPPAKKRRLFINLVPMALGCVLFPITVWLYLPFKAWLWMDKLPFIFQPGIWLGIGLMFTVHMLLMRDSKGILRKPLRAKLPPKKSNNDQA